jgi:tetratricopeptide (TPR) repeat protein
MSTNSSRVRAFPGARTALAALVLATALPAQAQFGGLLQGIMQVQQQHAAQEQAKREKEQAELEAKPFKKWAPAGEIPADVQAEAKAFAAMAKTDALRPLFERLFIEGERNATLNFQRIGLRALADGELDIAEKALDAAVARIEMVYADNPEAQKAKSLWSAEKVKDFKGEPYERAMAYFYRGLVYAARNDFQNARAMFKQADYQDTVAEAEQYAGDFGLMPYMAGWASYCDGNQGMAKDFLDQAAKADAQYKSLAVDQPLLVMFETGRAPFKFTGGKHGELLKWAPHATPPATLKSVCTGPHGTQCGGTVALGADLGFQATTRGGRPIDAILGGKASFKEGAQNVATVANVVGQLGALSGGSGGENLGMIGMFASLAATAAASQTQTQADIREWEQLPGNVWLATATAKSPEPQLLVRVDDAGTLADKPVRRMVDTPSCQLYWGRAVELDATNPEAGPVEAGKHARDPVFRQEIAGMFGA